MEEKYKYREKIIDEWFQSWHDKDFDEFDLLFDCDIYYSESWGPTYQGIEEIIRWKTKWHTHCKLLSWDIGKILHIDNISVVEWYFSNEDREDKDEFDGVSIIEWKKNKMVNLKEFASSLPHYRYFNKL